MDSKELESIFKIGETATVEFKRCGNKIESDVYETVCSFLNRFGGDLFLGVSDNGTVLGISEDVAPNMIKIFINCMSNPNLFSPTLRIQPNIEIYDGKTIIHIHIPVSPEVHTYKRVFYDRVGDADIRVISTAQIAQMYIRKQSIFTEQRIYPYVSMEDLRIDMLPRLRIMAANNRTNQDHPWNSMTDEELLRSTRLFSVDRSTGEKGYNLAAVMLLGKDDVISDIVPAYATDALLKRINIDRYDDREIIKTNLIESYERLMAFGRKHLMDKFFLEGDKRMSLREIITREMMANILIHREYISTYRAKFVIEKDKMYIENANRSFQSGNITPDNLEPNSKNPIIASFFMNIGYADQLGSGVRNLFKYSKFYSGKDPNFIENDIFKIIVPIDDNYLETTQSTQSTQSGVNITDVRKEIDIVDIDEIILNLIRKLPTISQKQISDKSGININTIKYHVNKMKRAGKIERIGSSRKGMWIVK